MTRARVTILLWLILGIVAVARATPHVQHMVRAFTADGANTVGEAGKVYFAHRAQEGLPMFASGVEPPYYPSVHGALLHATVGWIGAALDSSVPSLYTIGRSLSVLMTALAWIFLGAVGVRLGLPVPMIAVGGLLWVGTYTLVEHTISFRPDHWVLAFSALLCWLTTLETDRAGLLERRAITAAITVVPLLAFHIKATGLLLIGAVGLVHLVRRQWRRALIIGGAQAGLILASVSLMNVMSDGAYLAGLRGAVHVPWDTRLILLPYLARLGDPWIPLMLLGPMPLVIWLTLRPRDVSPSSAWAPVVSFWIVTLLGYGFATVRSGAAPYYFVEPASYGLLLVLCSVRILSNARPLDPYPSTGPVVVLLLLTVTVGTAIDSIRQPHGVDIALVRTEVLGAERGLLAERVNAQDGVCYSNDPSLNVLLDRPRVIYPLLQRQMIETGVLSSETLYGPLDRQELRCVIFSGIDWRYRGRPVVPEAFRARVEEGFSWSEQFGNYTIHYPDVVALPRAREPGAVESR